MKSRIDKDAVWFIYLVRTRTGMLYTGISTDVHRRFAAHVEAAGRGAKWLRGRGPLVLAFQSPIGVKRIALRVERRIKRLSKARKEALIAHPEILEKIVADCRT